jgi:bacteriorhodopsin
MGLVSMENLVSYSPAVYQLVGQILVFGFACQAAGFIFFMTTMKASAPRYRFVSILGAIVMTSAFLLLLHQWMAWEHFLVYRDGMFHPENGVFSNGFRYLNWAIDVPMLLLQLVIVLGLTSSESVKRGKQFVFYGLAMIFTGYLGQYYETTNMFQLWLWNIISWVFYIMILVLAWKLIGEALPKLPEKARSKMRLVRWWFIIVWTLYPIAYILPWIDVSEVSVAWRQGLFTLADILSKVIYGVIITFVAIDRSIAEGYTHAKEWMGQSESSE